MYSNRYLPYLILLPAFTVMGLVIFYPMAYSIFNSAFDTQAYQRAAQFIGLFLKEPGFSNRRRRLG